MRPFYTKKRFYVILLVIVSLLLFLVFKQTKENQNTTQEDSRHQVSRKQEKDVEGIVEESLATLEKPSHQVKVSAHEEVEEAVMIALSYVTSIADSVPQVSSESESGLLEESVLTILSDIEGNYDNRLSLTKLTMIQTLVTMYSVGYQFKGDSLKVYESNSDNVYQFVFIISRGISDNLSFVGNYVVGTGQLEITSMHGKPKVIIEEEK